MNNDLMFGSATAEWGTPQAFYDKLDAEFGFGLDVAASNDNAKAPVWYTKAYNALVLPWRMKAPQYYGGKSAVWCNPPYGDPELPCRSKCHKKRCVTRGFHITERIPGAIDFVVRAYEQSHIHGNTQVLLLPARTDTALFHDWAVKGEVRLYRGRLTFVGPDGAKNPAPFPSMLVIFGPGRGDWPVHHGMIRVCDQ